MLAEALQLDGHVVDTAPNGAVALELLGRRRYDVVITDSATDSTSASRSRASRARYEACSWPRRSGACLRRSRGVASGRAGTATRPLAPRGFFLLKLALGTP